MTPEQKKPSYNPKPEKPMEVLNVWNKDKQRDNFKIKVKGGTIRVY